MNWIDIKKEEILMWMTIYEKYRSCIKRRK